MKLNELKYTKGSKHSKKRVGRGTGSGHGKTSGRGQKGQKSRSGGGTRPGFEGGQNPLYRRIPKFGFTNINAKKYFILSLDDLEKLNIDNIDHEILYKEKIIKSKNTLIKILCNGKITKSINVKVNKISKNAIKEINNAGGKVEVL